MAQFLCPFELFCGPSTHRINATTSVQSISVNTRLFVSNSSCQYQFDPPATSASGDIIQVRLDTISNAVAIIN